MSQALPITPTLTWNLATSCNPDRQWPPRLCFGPKHRKEQIAKLEAEERAEQERRKAPDTAFAEGWAGEGAARGVLRTPLKGRKTVRGTRNHQCWSLTLFYAGVHSVLGLQEAKSAMPFLQGLNLSLYI